MLYSLLKIKSILNNKNVQCFDNLVYLGNGHASDVLVSNKKIALEILKSKDFHVYNFQERLQFAEHLAKKPLLRTSDHFSKQPLLIDGQSHVESRKKLIKVYELIYKDLDLWIKNFTESFFNGISNHKIDAIMLIDHFINSVFVEIIARYLQVHRSDIPKTPTGILSQLIPDNNVIETFELRLENLTGFVKSRLSELNRSQDEEWILTSIPVQGYETMLGALVYGLLNDPPNIQWEAAELMRSASSVSLLTRVARENVEIFGTQFYKNQLVFISPYAVNMNESFESDKSIEFGYGKKLCPEKKMSLRIAQEFLNSFYINNDLSLIIQKEGVFFERLSVLTQKRS